MKLPWRPAEREGKPFPRIFLSASVPKPDRHLKYLHGPVEPRLMLRVIETRVRDAVTSLVAETLRVGGQLVFGGHPAITPMVAATASSFSLSAKSPEKPVVLYQSEYFGNSEPPQGREEMIKLGLAEVIWVPAKPWDAAGLFPSGKRYLLDPAKFDHLRRGQTDEKAPNEMRDALTAFRVTMCLDAQPDAVVCIGGMEGIEAEALLYTTFFLTDDPGDRRRAFALKSTFGATAKLDARRFRFVDEDYMMKRGSAAGMETEAELVPTDEKTALAKQLIHRIPYDSIMRELVNAIVEAGPVSPGR
jgi:hypothetical protein